MKFKLVEEYITESYSVMSGHVLELVESCAENLKTLGYTINNDIEYRWTAATTYFGCIEPKNGRFIFALSVGIKDATDDDLKCTIYHEFAHYIANNNLIATGEYFWKNGKLCRNRRCSETSHGPMWRRIANDISRKTGVTITVSGGFERAEKTGLQQYSINSDKYFVRCNHCGTVISYKRQTDFCKNPNMKGISGQYKWRCGKCRAAGQFEIITKEEALNGRK